MSGVVRFFRSLTQTPLQTAIEKVIKTNEPFARSEDMKQCLMLALAADSPSKAIEDCLQIPLKTIFEGEAFTNRMIEDNPDINGQREVLNSLDLIRYFVLGFADGMDETSRSTSRRGSEKSLGGSSISDITGVHIPLDSTLVIDTGSTFVGDVRDIEQKSSTIELAYQLSDAIVSKLLAYRDQIERIGLPILRIHPKLASRLIAQSTQTLEATNSISLSVETESSSLEFATDLTGVRAVSAAALLLAIDIVNKNGAKQVHIRHKLAGLSQPPPRLSLSGSGSQAPLNKIPTHSTLQKASLLSKTLLPTHENGAQRLLSQLPLMVEMYLE